MITSISWWAENDFFGNTEWGEVRLRPRTERSDWSRGIPFSVRDLGSKWTRRDAFHVTWLSGAKISQNWFPSTVGAFSCFAVKTVNQLSVTWCIDSQPLVKTVLHMTGLVEVYIDPSTGLNKNRLEHDSKLIIIIIGWWAKNFILFLILNEEIQDPHREVWSRGNPFSVRDLRLNERDATCLCNVTERWTNIPKLISKYSGLLRCQNCWSAECCVTNLVHVRSCW